MSRLDVVLARLQERLPLGWSLSLERIGALMHKLGDPHLKLPPTIHVAGTNGKGSTTTFTRAILEAAGHRVHVHTSPHLVRFNERYRLGAPGGGRLATDDELADALEACERAAEGVEATYFELATAAVFVLFAAHPADYAVVEVGLGGRLDATNVIPPPAVAAITPISFDHERYLGDTLAAIAAEKAGIVKRGSRVVSAPQADEVVSVLDRAAARAGLRLGLGGRDWTVESENGRLVFQDDDGLLDLPPPRLLGRHQYVNAGTAIAALRAAGLAPDPKTIERGLTAAEWPARMQRLQPGPVTARAPQGSEVWLDGGHNPGAGEVISAALADLEERVARPLFLVTGMLNTKDPVGFFEPFAGLARQVFTVPIRDSASARSPEDLAEAARKAGLQAVPMASVEAALDALHPWRFERPPRILICGSLYLAGEVLAANLQTPA